MAVLMYNVNVNTCEDEDMNKSMSGGEKKVLSLHSGKRLQF